MIAALALLVTISSPPDSTRLPAAMRLVVAQVLQEVARDPDARSPTDIYIDVSSFRVLLGGYEPDAAAWANLVLAAGPKGSDRSKERVWQCSPGGIDQQTPCLPMLQGKILVYAVKQSQDGTSLKVGVNAAWSIWNKVKGQLTGVGASYEAVLEPSARGWLVKSVKRVLAFSKGLELEK